MRRCRAVAGSTTYASLDMVPTRTESPVQKTERMRIGRRDETLDCEKSKIWRKRDQSTSTPGGHLHGVEAIPHSHFPVLATGEETVRVRRERKDSP